MLCVRSVPWVGVVLIMLHRLARLDCRSYRLQEVEMPKSIDETVFAQAVQLAAGFLAGAERNSTPGDDMREAVLRAYQALQEARHDLQNPQ